MVFVSGEAGVGKSRLIRELTSIARSEGVPVLVGRALPTSGQVAYRPVAEALAQALRDRKLLDEPELAGCWLRPVCRQRSTRPCGSA